MTGTSRCRSCGALIVWAVTDTKKRMPVDHDAVAGGNLVLYTEELSGEPPEDEIVQRVRVATPADRELAAAEGRKLWRSHFVTCPQRRAWRKEDGNAPRRG